MRGDPDRARGPRARAASPRGEAARVAARVEALLRDYRATHPGVPVPSGAGGSEPGAVAWLDDVLPGRSAASEPPPWLDEPAEWEPAPDPAARAGDERRFAFAQVEEGDADPVKDGEPAVANATARRAGLWQRIVGHVPVRLDPGRGSVVAVGVAVVLVAVIAGVWLVSHRPQALPVSATSHPAVASPDAAPVPRSGAGSRAGPGGPTGSDASTPVTPPGSPAVVVVDVAGKVRRPGIYRLPNGARVDDAIRAAGGARPGVDLSGLNLAARVADGQQIAVGVTGAPGGGAAAATGVGSGGGGTAGSSAGSGPVDLNTASLEQLETLPGVGPVLAQHILDFRTQHGSFGSVNQLREVSGIGDVRFSQLRPLVTV